MGGAAIELIAVTGGHGSGGRGRVDEVMVELDSSAAPMAALDEVFRASQRDLLRIIVPLTGGDRAAAEDLVAEAFARAPRERVRVGTYDRPDLWLRRVALNLAITAHRTREVLDEGVSLLTDPTGTETLLVEGGGWNAGLPIDDVAWSIPDEVLLPLVATLELDATDAGPRALRADGLEVVESFAYVSPTDPPIDRSNGGLDALQVMRFGEDGGAVRVEADGPRSEAVEPSLTFAAHTPD